MRVLVTGATGALGTAVVDRLARAGAEVRAMARRRPARLPVGVEFFAGDIRDFEAVNTAVRDVDVVAHLAWVVTSGVSEHEMETINLDGTANVLKAMDGRGIDRLVFSSSVTAYGSFADHPQGYREDEPLRPHARFIYGTHKKVAEEMIQASSMAAVVPRVGPVMGRGVDNTVSRLFAGPSLLGVRGDDVRWQFIHADDVARFFADACLGDRAGVVNLAADDALTLEEVGALMDKRVTRLSLDNFNRLLTVTLKLGIGEMDVEGFSGVRYIPTADTTRLREQWGFECAWTSADTMIDLSRSMSRVRYFGPARIPVPTRLPWSEPPSPAEAAPADGVALVDPSAPGMAGEFDEWIDPRFDTWTATNLSEAFPGPLTPLSLTVALDALRAGCAVIVDLLGLDDAVLAHETRHRMIAVFGHRIYLNVSLARETARLMPGTSPAEIDRQYLGIPLPPDAPRERVTRDVAVRGLRVLRRIGPKAAGLGTEARQLEDDAERLRLDAAAVASLPQDQLVARIALLHDVLCQGWTAVILVNMLAGSALGAIEKAGGDANTRGGIADLASARALGGIEDLASRADRSVARALLDDLPALRAEVPAFAAALDELVAACGHRGPGENELANPVFADDPAVLLRAVAAAAGPQKRVPARTTTPLRLRPLVANANRTLETRERIRDAVARLTHELRLAVRERGARLADAGVLGEADDVFYLTYDEVLDPPTGVAAGVAPRRAERERLAALRLPASFTGRWEPQADGTPLAAGETLTGIPASRGTTRGPARIASGAAPDHVEPGDVLVANVTDTGWTPLFACAAAVVTDIGGLLSHAAVVAREFGIPCVVGTKDATARLRNGQLVEVDGGAGTVTAL